MQMLICELFFPMNVRSSKWNFNSTYICTSLFVIKQKKFFRNSVGPRSFLPFLFYFSPSQTHFFNKKIVSFYHWQYILLLMLFYQREIRSVSATSRIRLLDLFQDNSNFSNPQAQSYQVRARFKAAVRHSQKYSISIYDQLIDGMTSDVVGIVGPSSSSEADKTATFGETIDILVVSYSATDADLSSRNIYPAFYRTVV